MASWQAGGGRMASWQAGEKVKIEPPSQAQAKITELPGVVLGVEHEEGRFHRVLHVRAHEAFQACIGHTIELQAPISIEQAWALRRACDPAHGVVSVTPQ